MYYCIFYNNVIKNDVHFFFKYILYGENKVTVIKRIHLIRFLRLEKDDGFKKIYILNMSLNMKL